MKTLALRYFLLMAYFGFALGRITFSCKKFYKKGLEEKIACRENHLKLFFGKQDHKSLDYKCCQGYLQTICANKIFLKCQNGTLEEPLEASRSGCPTADKMKCTKFDANDWGEEDPKKQANAGKSGSSGKGPKKSSKGNSAEGSEMKSSNVRLLLLIFALLFIYFR